MDLHVTGYEQSLGVAWYHADYVHCRSACGLLQQAWTCSRTLTYLAVCIKSFRNLMEPIVTLQACYPSSMLYRARIPTDIGLLQDCEAGGQVLVDAHSNQHHGLMRAVPSWLGKMLPPISFGRRLNSANTVAIRQTNDIAQTADAAAEDALAMLTDKQAAQNQHGQSSTATGQHGATATDDIFHLFNDTHINSLESDDPAASSEQQQPAGKDNISAERQD